jgi:hypothetical protein
LLIVSSLGCNDGLHLKRAIRLDIRPGIRRLFGGSYEAG